LQGHFPGQPVMPGVLIVEAMAQVGAVALLSRQENAGRIPFFAGIDGVRFRRQVIPGDTLRLELELTRVRSTAGKGQGSCEKTDAAGDEGRTRGMLASVQSAREARRGKRSAKAAQTWRIAATTPTSSAPNAQRTVSASPSNAHVVGAP